ncbi:MAG: hypothetical protein EOO38_14420, partial [Cytophagaceae bacterium]
MRNIMRYTQSASFDDDQLRQNLGTPKRAAEANSTVSAADVDTLHKRPSLLDTAASFAPQLPQPGAQAFDTPPVVTAGLLAEAIALRSVSPVASKMVLFSLQRASGAPTDYKVDLYASAVSQERLDELSALPCALGRIKLTMTHRDGMDLYIERLECLLDAMTASGRFLHHMADPDLRQRYINANAAPEPGELRAPADDELAREEATETLATHCVDQR